MFRVKNVIAIMMVIAVLIGVPAAAFASTAQSGVLVEMEKVAGQTDIYKLNFKAKTDTVVRSFVSVFSFDSDIITPANYTGSHAVSDWGELVLDSTAEGIRNAPIDYNSRDFWFLNGARWRKEGSRAALYTTFFSLNPPTSAGEYVRIFEFYFKLNGDTSAIDENTFKFEDAEDSVFISMFNPSIHSGITLFDESTTEPYLWGASETVKESYPDAVVPEEIAVVDTEGNTLWEPPVIEDGEVRLVLKANKPNVSPGQEIEVSAGFTSKVESNVVALEFRFDTEAFKYEGFEAASGVTSIDVEDVDAENGTLWVPVMIKDGFVEGVSDLGTITLTALEDASAGKSGINLNADYVVKGEEDEVSVKQELTIEAAELGININEATYTLVDLSDIAEAFGVEFNATSQTCSEEEWNENYAQWDFFNNGKIDISNISFVAVRIPRAI